MNAYVRVTTTPVRGGADVRIVPRRDHVMMQEIDHDTGEVLVRVRKDAGPREGETIMVGKRHVVVAKRRWDTHGRLQVLDEDTGAWLAVE